jgi:lipoprotein signal peptidase
MIEDLLIMAGSLGFLLAEIKQFLKLRTETYETNAISRKHLIMKIFSLVCYSVAFTMLAVYTSVVIMLAQLTLTSGILYYTLKRYKK